jgi:hypothetical protein
MYLCVDRIQELQTAHGCTQLMLAVLRTMSLIFNPLKNEFILSCIQNFILHLQAGNLLPHYKDQSDDASLEASAAVWFRSSLFFDVAQQKLAFVYRRFGTIYRFHLQESAWPLIMGRHVVPKRRQKLSNYAEHLKRSKTPFWWCLGSYHLLFWELLVCEIREHTWWVKCCFMWMFSG